MVEWKKIGEICTFSQGIQVPISEQSTMKLEGYSRFLRIVDYTQGNEPPRYVPINDRRYWISKNEIAVVRYGTPGYVCRGYEGILANNLFKVNINNINDLEYSFLTYVLKSNIFQSAIKQKSSGGALQAISFGLIRDILIPIPSLKEQNRIVGILDTFTASIENLKEQIAERRKQFEHYRDQLLDLEGKDNNIVPLGDVCEMIKGNGVQKADFVDEGVGCIHYGQIYTHYGAFTYTTNKFVSKETFEKARKASKGDIVMTDTSENVEDICKSVAYLGEEDIAVSNHALILKHKQNPKFLSYSTLTKSFFNQKRKVVVGVKVSGIKPEHLAQIKIYLPSFVEQSRIVSILDTFEASITNLEAQLSQREKQYEYYRNKLLTFE